MQRQEITLDRREETGKGPNRRLRAAGRIPAVIYGTGTQPEKASVSSREFEKIMSSAEAESAIFTLNFQGEKQAAAADNSVVVRELQRDPVTKRILHADLYRIRMDVENEFELSMHPIGTPVGVREGGILETHLRALEIRCLPDNLPPAIDIDVRHLGINHALHVRDITPPQGVTILTDPDEVIFNVLPSKETIAASPEEEGELTQPEVVGKKKPDEEEKAEK